MEKIKVLIVDDDENICKILEEYFSYEGFQVVLAHDGQEGLNLVEQENPDLIILDIMLPRVDGWEFCQALRPDSDIPIIILSAKTRDTDRITGLEIGADDYVIKPFSPKEVVARARAVLRRIRQQEVEEETLHFPGLAMDRTRREVKINGETINLTPKEFDLLWVLASSPRQVFPRDDLLERVWGYDFFGDTRTVDTHIKSLRNKLKTPARKYLKTVWGVGYKFEGEED